MATLFAKSELSGQLNGLEKIWNDFLRDNDLRIADLKLKEWRKNTEGLLNALGKDKGLEPVSKLVSESIEDPTERFFEYVKKYRVFLSLLIKELEQKAIAHSLTNKDLSELK